MSGVNSRGADFMLPRSCKQWKGKEEELTQSLDYSLWMNIYQWHSTSLAATEPPNSEQREPLWATGNSIRGKADTAAHFTAFHSHFVSCGRLTAPKLHSGSQGQVPTVGLSMCVSRHGAAFGQADTTPVLSLCVHQPCKLLPKSQTGPEK